MNISFYDFFTRYQMVHGMAEEQLKNNSRSRAEEMCWQKSQRKFIFIMFTSVGV